MYYILDVKIFFSMINGSGLHMQDLRESLIKQLFWESLFQIFLSPMISHSVRGTHHFTLYLEKGEACSAVHPLAAVFLQLVPSGWKSKKKRNAGSSSAPVIGPYLNVEKVSSQSFCLPRCLLLVQLFSHRFLGPGI